MNNDKKVLWANRALFILVGIWLSALIVTYSGKDMLYAFSIFGAGLCFLGFIHYYGKANDKQKRETDRAESKKEKKGLLSKRPRIWKE